MGERSIPSKAIRVGPHLVEVVSDLPRLHFIYLDVSGTSYKVLGVLGTAFLLVSRYATTPARDLYGSIEVLANDLQNREQLSIYRVVSTTTPTGEFTSLKVSG